MSADNTTQPPPTGSGTSGAQLPSVSQSSFSPPVKALPYEDLVAVCQALGGIPGRTLDRTITNATGTTKPSSSVDEKQPSVGTQPDDEEKQLKFSPTVPPPTGLYKRVINKRKTAWWKFQILALVYNACISLQLLLGATLTALGASDKKRSAAITILAALNTVDAGLIALLHNSGIPSRYRNDWDEWSKVEVYMADIMQSGVVQANMNKEDVIATCQAMYKAAFDTVENNQPSSYVPALATAVTEGTKSGQSGQSGHPPQTNNNFYAL